MAKSIYTTEEVPEYWSITPEVWESWVVNMGVTAAAKLAGACIEWFFYQQDPEGVIKLTKQAQAMFNAERPRLNRRRASALNGAASARKSASTNVENSHATNVEKQKGTKKRTAKRPEKQAEKAPEKKAGQIVHLPAKTTYASPLPANRNKNRNINPQTPAAPRGGARGSGGTMSAAEFAALAATIGYDSPTAYGMRAV